MKLHLHKYISFFGAGLLIFCCLSMVNAQQDIESIKVIVTFDGEPTDYSVSKAPLKYNKTFAVSFQVDDGVKEIYSVVYSNFSNLFYTDGCENDIPFTASSSAYCFQSPGENGPDMHDPLDPSYDANYLTWDEIKILYDLNYGILNHGVNGDESTNNTFMKYSIGRNKSYFRRRLYDINNGRNTSSGFVCPGNIAAWTQPAFDLGYGVVLNKKDGGPIGFSGGDVTRPDIDWTSQQYIKRQHANITVTVSDFVNELYTQSIAEDGRYWGALFTHQFDIDGYPAEMFQQDFAFIASQHGKGAGDDIIVASDEELYDYLHIHDAVTLNPILVGNSLEITFSGNVPDDLRFYAMSLLIDSDVGISDITVENANGFSRNVNTGLVNFNWDDQIVPSNDGLAEQYTALAESSGAQFDAWIAQDYVYTLPPSDTKLELTDRLCNLPDLEYEDGFCDPVIENVEIFGDTIICQGDTSYLTATAGMEYYEWSTGETSPSIKVKPSLSTEYWVKGTINAVQTQDFTTVVVNPIPNIVSHSPGFVNHTPGINDTLWVSTNDETLNYLWDTGSQDSSIIVDPNFTTEYYVDVLTDSGCSVRQDYVVEVLSTFDFTYDSVCLGGITHIQNISAYPDSIISITWDLNSDGVFDDAEGNEVEHEFESAGNHLVGMRLLPFEGNFEVVFQVVPVGDYPIPDFLHTNTCLPNSTNFEDQSTVIVGDIDSWFWEFGDTGTDVGSFVTHKYFTVGTYIAKLHIKSNIGCKDSISKPIDIGESPNFVVLDENNNTLYANDTTKIDKTDSLYVTIQDYENYDSIIWNNTVRDKYYYVTEEGRFSVEVYNTVCSNNEFHYLKFNTGGGGEPTTNEIMSLFTPNGDGYNDSWVVNDPSIVGNIKLNVYNRYGNSVYSSDNYNNDWQGTFDGAALPQATYYYIIEDDGGNVFKGPITILR